MNDKPTDNYFRLGPELERAVVYDDGLTAARLLREIGSCDWLKVINSIGSHN